MTLINCWYFHIRVLRVILRHCELLPTSNRLNQCESKKRRLFQLSQRKSGSVRLNERRQHCQLPDFSSSKVHLDSDQLMWFVFKPIKESKTRPLLEINQRLNARLSTFLPNVWGQRSFMAADLSVFTSKIQTNPTPRGRVVVCVYS